MSAQVMASKQQQELATFDEVFDDLETQLELVCTSVAAKAYSAGLIEASLKDAAVKKVPASEYDRTLLLIGSIEKTLRSGSADEAKIIMKKLITILQNEISFRSLAKKLEDELQTRPGDDAEVLVEYTEVLAQRLQGSITSVAAQAFSGKLISAGVKDLVVDPKADHDKIYINKILEQVRRRIKHDPTMLKVFIDKVMKPMGVPFKKLTEKLSEGLSN